MFKACKINYIVIIFIIAVIGIVSFSHIFTSNKDNCINNKEEIKELTIYSGRREKFTLPVVEKFEKETGIKVNLMTGKAAQYAHRIIEEKENTQADIFLANDAGVLEYLRSQNMLSEIKTSSIQKVPEKYKANDNTWVGLSARARVFLYNKDLISEEEMPKSIFDLTKSKYKGQFAMNRAGNESMVSYFASIRTICGEERTLQLIKGIMSNKPYILKSHTNVRKAVGTGEVKFGLVNNYHYKLQLKEEGYNNVGVIYTDQGEDGIGTFINVSGVAIPKYCKHPNNANKFIEFLLQPEIQKLNEETPIIPNIEGINYPKFKSSDMSLSKLGTVWKDTIELMEKGGYAD